MYAVRHYLKGVSSGNKDIWSGDYVPSESEVVGEFGAAGKYVVFRRGKGIKGMQKVAQYGPFKNGKAHSEWTPKMFAAEDSLTVRKEIKLSELSDDDLEQLYDSMLDTPVEGEEDFEKFTSDVKRVKAEMFSRMRSRAEVVAAEVATEVASEPLAEVDNPPVAMNAETGTKFGVAAVTIAGVLGLVAGGVFQEVRWRRKADEMVAALRRLEDKLDKMERDQKHADNHPQAFAPFAPHNLLRSYSASNPF